MLEKRDRIHTMSLSIALLFTLFLLASGIASHGTAEPTRASYGVVLNVIDTPYFPYDGKWTAFINLTVRNTGSQEDTFSLESTEKPQDWEVIVLETTVNVGTEPPTGPTKSTAILVKCPEMELEGDDYGVTIKATSQGDTSKSHSINIDLTVLLVPLVRVEGPVNVEETDSNPHNGIPDYREGEPGDYMTYDFRVRNIGNGDETFLISMQSPNNWWHQLQGPAFTDSLGINQTTLKRVKVKIPEDANKGDSDVLHFIATAQSDEKVKHMTTVETEVKQIHMISLEAPLYTTYTYPGSEVEMDFNITNIGNGKDDTVRIRLATLPEGWQGDIDLSLVPEDGIEVYDKASCSFSLVAPLNTLNRTYSVVIEGFTSGKELPDSTLKFNITVYQEYRINLTKEQTLPTSLPGQRVIYNFILKNNGNGEDEFMIETVSTGKMDISVWCELETDNVQLADGLSNNILLYCDIPEMTKAGTYSIKVRVTSLKAREMERIVTEELTFSFKVGKQFALDLTVPEKDKVLIINSDERSAEDRAALVHFNVTNRGNSRDIVEFTADFPAEKGWPAPDFMITKVMLEYGEYKSDLVLTVNAPRGAPIGEYNFSIRAESTLDPGEKKARKSVSFKVRIVRFDVAIDREIRFGEDTLVSGDNFTQEGIGGISVDLRIRNSGNLDIDGLNVSLYINEKDSEARETRTVFDFPAGAESNLTFDLQLATTGTYKIIFIADSDGTIPEINEINNIAHVTYIIKNPDTNGNGKGEITYDLFGRTWSFTEFLLLIMAAVLILVLIGLSVMRLARHKKREEVVDTGLVDTGEYKFREKEEATFKGLELDDYITEEEEGKETAVKTGKRKGEDYYISEEDLDEKSKERGFTVAAAIREQPPPSDTSPAPFPTVPETEEAYHAYQDTDIYAAEDEYEGAEAYGDEGRGAEVGGVGGGKVTDEGETTGTMVFEEDSFLDEDGSRGDNLEPLMKPITEVRGESGEGTRLKPAAEERSGESATMRALPRARTKKPTMKPMLKMKSTGKDAGATVKPLMKPAMKPTMKPKKTVDGKGGSPLNSEDRGGKEDRTRRPTLRPTMKPKMTPKKKDKT